MAWKIGDKVTVNPQSVDFIPLEQGGNTRKTTFQKIKELIIGSETLKTTSQEVIGAVNELKDTSDSHNAELENHASQLSENTKQIALKANQSDLDVTNNNILNLQNNKSEQAYVEAEFAIKRNSTDKILLSDLTDEVKQAMAGSTPINATPGDNTVSNQKLETILRNKINNTILMDTDYANKLTIDGSFSQNGGILYNNGGKIPKGYSGNTAYRGYGLNVTDLGAMVGESIICYLEIKFSSNFVAQGKTYNVYGNILYEDSTSEASVATILETTDLGKGIKLFVLKYTLPKKVMKIIPIFQITNNTLVTEDVWFDLYNMGVCIEGSDGINTSNLKSINRIIAKNNASLTDYINSSISKNSIHHMLDIDSRIISPKNGAIVSGDRLTISSGSDGNTTYYQILAQSDNNSNFNLRSNYNTFYILLYHSVNLFTNKTLSLILNIYDDSGILTQGVGINSRFININDNCTCAIIEYDTPSNVAKIAPYILVTRSSSAMEDVWFELKEITFTQKDIDSISTAQKEIDNIYNKLDSVSKYNTIADSLVNIFTSFSAFGSATVSNKVATVSGQNGGLVSNTFTASSNKVAVKLKGSYNVPILSITLKIIKSDNSANYITLQQIPLTNGVIDTTVSFDAVYQAIYNSAVSFAIIINSVNSTNTGTITITDIEINELDSFRQSEYYHTDFTTMMENVFSGIDEAKQLPVNPVTDLFLNNANGNKYKVQINADGTILAIPCMPSKVLFMGNSLLQGMGTFGMCASSSKKDFYYYVSQAILGKNASTTFAKLGVAPFEQSETDATADSYFINNISTFTSDLDLIILQIGDNVNTEARQTVFTKNFPLLVQRIRNQCTKARIIFIGVWFNSSVVYNVIQSTSEKYGCELVDIRDLNITANQGYSGQTYIGADGVSGTVSDKWITHPGDTGMSLIADRIISQLKI